MGLSAAFIGAHVHDRGVSGRIGHALIRGGRVVHEPGATDDVQRHPLRGIAIAVQVGEIRRHLRIVPGIQARRIGRQSGGQRGRRDLCG